MNDIFHVEAAQLLISLHSVHSYPNENTSNTIKLSPNAPGMRSSKP